MSVFMENCFGCLRLRTGVLIIGYLHMIASCVFFVMHFIMLMSFYISYPSVARAPIVNALSILEACILSYMLAAILLIYGATKGNRHFMLPFSAIVAFQCAFASSYEIICCLFLVSTLPSLAIAFIYVGLNVFALVVLVSHHQELKKYTLHNREDDQIAIVNTP